MGALNRLLGSVVAIFIILMGLPVAMAVYQGSFTQQEFDAWLLDPEVKASLHSDAANTDDLGSTTREWRDLYLGDSGNILWGNAQDVDLGRSAANTLTLATGDTLAITSAGSLTVAGNAVADVGGFTMNADINFGGNDALVVNTMGGSANATSLTIQGGLTQSTQRDIVFKTSNVADALGSTRLTIGSNAAEATATWANVVQAGVKLSNALNANSQNITSVGASGGGLWVGRSTDPTGGATRSIAIDGGNGASSDAQLWIAGSKTTTGDVSSISFNNYANTGAAINTGLLTVTFDDTADTGADYDTGKFVFKVKKDEDASLNVAMTLDSNGGLSFPAFGLTIPDNANGGTAAAYTFTPVTDAARLVEITCQDAQGCDVTMGETSVKNGQVVTLVNVSANTVNFADSAGVSELAGAFAAGVNDNIQLYYSSALAAWVELDRSDN